MNTRTIVRLAAHAILAASPLFFNSNSVLAQKMDAMSEMDDNTTTFTVKIENTTKPDAFTASNGVKWSLGYSPGTWAVHTSNAVFFTTGAKDRGQGLEAQSEDGDPTMLAGSVARRKGVVSSGLFNTPVGAMKPGPITPGTSYEFTITAKPGQKFSLAMMFGQSNDLFYAPDVAGIALFDAKGRPVSGDITGNLLLWDAGTEVNQEPGIGPDQGPRQKGPNTGAAENGVVRLVNDRFTYPAASKVMRVTITPQNTHASAN